MQTTWTFSTHISLRIEEEDINHLLEMTLNL